MNEVSDIVLFLGRFHPLVVHLPIGFLLFAFVLEVYSKFKENPVLTSAVPLALLCGSLSAALACILGYMLSLSGEYNGQTLDLHMWFGITVTVITFLAWLIRTDKIKLSFNQNIKSHIATLTLIVILISVTGHYGGNLTHGSDYLTKYAPFNNGMDEAVYEPVTKIEDAIIYGHLVRPILEEKCVSCHNADKKKGGLMLHDSIAIFKGGENGDVVIPGNALGSEMLRRVHLDPEHEDFMPPEGKTPLADEEIAIITYWIKDANADFKKTIGQVETSENALNIASSLLGFSGKKNGNQSLPTVSSIEEETVNELIGQGFKIRELVFDSNLYEVNLKPKTIIGSTPELLSKKLQKLLKIKENIIWLYIEDNQVNDSHLAVIKHFKNLQKLVLNTNPISDKGIAELVKLNQLTSLNLYNTNITKKSLAHFSEMPKLERVYAWQTDIKTENLESYASEKFPEVIISP